MTRRPNVLFVICDDLAHGDLVCHGNPHARTPQLDALAAESARITRYCSGPLCTPARAALMTGRHPYRTRAIDTYLARSMLDPDEVTLPRMLKTAGYATGLFGKWHLGDCYPMRPCDRGFDESLWHRGGGLRQFANVGHFDGRDGYFNPRLTHQDALTDAQGYCTDIFTDAAVDWIRARPGDQPWFAYVAYNAPHTPLEIGAEWVRPFAASGLPEAWQKVYGMVANIDHNVAKLLNLLAQTGQAGHTLVVFTSDHGPCLSAAVDGRSRFNGGLRDAKGTLYEGGVRCPCFVRWPGTLPAGEVRALANPIDWLPTLAAACGATLPADRVIDGLDLLPVLRGQAPAPARSIIMQWHRGNTPVRFRNATVITPRWKWVRPDPLAPDELYDVPADPAEAHNVAGAHPELVAGFISQYAQWFDDVGATRPDNYAPPRIVLGHPDAARTHLTLQDGRALGTCENWGTTFPAAWLVNVHRAGDYVFELDAGDNPPGLTWTLRAGDAVATFTLPQRHHGVTLRLNAGPQTLTCLAQPAAADPATRTIGEIAVTGPA